MVNGFGYTPCEALCLNVPVIVTPCDSFLEIGVKDNVNGFVLPFDMENINVEKIYNAKLEFEYKPPKDRYNTILGKKKSNYIGYDKRKAIVKVKDIVGYYDDLLFNKRMYVSDGEYEVTLERAYQLINANVCDLVRII